MNIDYVDDVGSRRACTYIHKLERWHSAMADRTDPHAIVVATAELGKGGVAVNGGGASAATEFCDDDLVQVSVLARWLPSRLVFEFVTGSIRVHGAVRSFLTIISAKTIQALE